MKKTLNSFFAGMLLMANTLAFTAVPSAVSAQNQINEGSVVKARGFSSLYYIGPNKKRFVFPNEHAYFSWYNDFSNVSEVNVEDVSQFQLAGNVQYRPGVVLVKIQTDPKVYAVGHNGRLHWIKTETLAKKLYGEKWNLLVDDVPDVYFANYTVDSPIETDSDFDSDDEEELIQSISDNLKEKIEKKIQKKKLNICEKFEKRINKLQKRLTRRGIKVDLINDDFVNQCVGQVIPDQNEDNDKKNKDKNERDKGKDKKIAICHFPPGNPSNGQTILVGIPAAKAHLAHGDTLGACDKDKEKDKIAPILSNISATSTSPTSEKITWMTNEISTSKVVYSTQSLVTATSTQSISDINLIKEHSITLTNLLNSTKYFFMVESRDPSGNTATSTEMMFTTSDVPPADTTAPIITVLSTSSTTATSTMVTWTTNELSTSIIEYATSTLASTTPTVITDNTLAISHSVALSGLTASTTYYFRVKSKDFSGNMATSDEKTFTTNALPDTTPPVISSIITTPSATSTIVVWITDEPASSKIVYSHMSLANATTTQSIFDATLVTSHSIMITGLATSTQYFFKVESSDVKGNTSTSAQATFTTLP